MIISKIGLLKGALQQDRVREIGEITTAMTATGTHQYYSVTNWKWRSDFRLLYAGGTRTLMLTDGTKRVGTPAPRLTFQRN
jgi:hypothetical protein